MLKQDRFCLTFYGYPKLDAFVHAWTQAGFDTVGRIVWTKPYASSTRYLAVTTDAAYLLAKGRPEKPAHPLPDAQPWEYTGNRVHPTERAVSTLLPPIRAFSRPGDVVLDPFAGSGSKLVAVALLDRRYFGIEWKASTSSTPAVASPVSSASRGSAQDSYARAVAQEAQQPQPTFGHPHLLDGVG